MIILFSVFSCFTHSLPSSFSSSIWEHHNNVRRWGCGSSREEESPFLWQPGGKRTGATELRGRHQGSRKWCCEGRNRSRKHQHLFRSGLQMHLYAFAPFLVRDWLFPMMLCCRRDSRPWGEGQWATAWGARCLWAAAASAADHGLYWWRRGEGRSAGSGWANHVVWRGSSRPPWKVRPIITCSVAVCSIEATTLTPVVCLWRQTAEHPVCGWPRCSEEVQERRREGQEVTGWGQSSH